MSWIDVHTHLNMLEKPVEESLREAELAGVERLINIGTEPEDWPVVSQIAQDFFPKVSCFLGLHPHEAKKYDGAAEKQLVAGLGHPWVLGVGEIGLDYYYDNSPREVQRQAFRRQMQIAADHDLPVEIHSRDAEQDTAEILADFSGKVTGLLHCFTSSDWFAKEALRFGFDISFSGVVTFNKAAELRKVVQNVPLDRLHIETDAPFLAPDPHRGKKNHPALVIHTAQKVAELKNIPIRDLALNCRRNACRLFKKLQWD